MGARSSPEGRGQRSVCIQLQHLIIESPSNALLCVNAFAGCWGGLPAFYTVIGIRVFYDQNLALTTMPHVEWSVHITEIYNSHFVNNSNILHTRKATPLCDLLRDSHVGCLSQVRGRAGLRGRPTTLSGSRHDHRMLPKNARTTVSSMWWQAQQYITPAISREEWYTDLHYYGCWPIIVYISFIGCWPSVWLYCYTHHWKGSDLWTNNPQAIVVFTPAIVYTRPSLYPTVFWRYQCMGVVLKGTDCRMAAWFIVVFFPVLVSG